MAIYLIPDGKQWLDTPDSARGACRLHPRVPALQSAGLSSRDLRSDILVPALSFVALAEMVRGAAQAVTLATLAVLAAAAVSADRDRKVLPLVDRISPLGQLTNSMYIWHRLFILASMNVVADKLFHENIPVVIAMSLVTYGSIAAASYLGFFMIEVPARKALMGMMRRRRSPNGTTDLIAL